MSLITRRARRGAALAGLAAAALTASACSDAGSDQGSDELKVVATTNVWAEVARAVAGPGVQVESIIQDPTADPHSYESSPQDAAKLSDADLVLLNGGGYDEFAEQILSGSGQGKPTVQAVDSEHEGEAAGHTGEAHEHAGGAHGHTGEAHEHTGHDHSVNEHVWYDLHVVHETADQVADQLAKLRPAQAQQFRDNAAKFDQQVDALGAKVDQIAATDRGKKVIVTEPVAHYLVERAGLTDITPQSFVNAVEAENDPSAAAVAEIQDAVRSGQAAAMIYNPQTESPVTKSVREAAQAAGTPVVEMTETLPQDQDYVQWMDGQISRLQQALAARP